MEQSLEIRIRERAYEMWTAHGCVHGLASGRAGSVGNIDGRPCRQTKSEQEATVVRTFKGRQNACAGRLTPNITSEVPGRSTAGYSSGSGSLTTAG